MSGRYDCQHCGAYNAGYSAIDAERIAAQARLEHVARENDRLREAGQELVDVVDGLASDKEVPDSFTTQPMRAAMRGEDT